MGYKSSRSERSVADSGRWERSDRMLLERTSQKTGGGASGDHLRRIQGESSTLASLRFLVAQNDFAQCL